MSDGKISGDPAKEAHGISKVMFQAKAQDCGVADFSAVLWNVEGRRVELPLESKAMRDYLARMKRAREEAIQEACGDCRVPHLWIKGVQSLRQFSVRGP